MRAALRAAIAERDDVATEAIRAALSALGNAGAVDSDALPAAPAGSVHVAGSRAGAGAAEVPRRRLTAAEERAVVDAEIAEMRAAAETYSRLGEGQRAARLSAQADVLERLRGA